MMHSTKKSIIEMLTNDDQNIGIQVFGKEILLTMVKKSLDQIPKEDDEELDAEDLNIFTEELTKNSKILADTIMSSISTLDTSKQLETMSKIFLFMSNIFKNK